MADVVATLGLAVDSTGAIVNLKQFETATKATGSAATKTADEVVAASNRINAAMASQASAARAQLAAQAEARAAATAERTTLIDRNEAFLAEERARRSLAVATKEASRATSDHIAFEVLEKITVQEVLGPLADKTAAINRSAEAAAENSAATRTMNASLAATGGVIGAALIAVQVLGVAYDVFTEKTRKMKAEQDEARKSLEALQDRQRQGAGGKLVDDVEKQRSTLRSLASDIASITAELNRPSIIVSNNNTGATDTRAFAEARLAAKRDEYNQLQSVVETGEREIDRLVLQQETERLAALRTAGALTIAENKRVTDRVAELRADLASNVAAGGDLGERVRMVNDIRALTATTDAEKEAVKAATAARKAHNEANREALKLIKNHITLTKESAEAEAARNNQRNIAFAQTGVDAVAKLDAEIERRNKISSQEAKQYLQNEEKLAQLRAEVSLIGKSGEEREVLIDAENRRLAQAEKMSASQVEEFVALQRTKREAESFAATLQSVLGIAQLLAAAWGDVGQEIAKAASGAQAIVSGVGAFKSASSAAEKAGAVGSIAGGAFVLLDALSSLDRSQQRNAERANALTKAFQEQVAAANDLNDITTETAAGITATVEALTAAALEAHRAQIIAARGNGTQIRESITQLADAMKEIERLERNRTKALKEQEEALKAFSASNDVLRLRQQGRDSEADAAQAVIDINEKVAAAVAKFGNTAEVAEYRLLLMAQAAKDVAEAEASRQREVARRVEDERRNIFDNDNAVRAITDPRGASQAAFDESLQRRYTDAIARGASDMELLSIAARNAAEALDRAAQIAEQDLRTTESLIARALGASGNVRGQQDAAFNAGQRQEMADAIRAGMSEGNLALLRFTQFAERSQLQMQRAIEDGTKAIQDRARDEIAAIDLLIEVTQNAAAAQIKAIDEQIEATQTAARATAKAFDQQISAIREQTKAQTDAIDAQIDSARDALDAAQKQLSVLEKSVQTNTQVVTAMRELRDSLKLGNLSPLSPEDKLAEARAQFERTAAAAAGGDSAAALRVPAAAQALLEASRAYNASGPGYVSDFNRVNEVLNAIEAQYGATLPVEEAQLEAARQAVDALQQTIESLGEQKQAITDAAQRQIDALQSAKDKAAEDAQKQLDKLNEQKDAINEGTRLTIERLQETRQAIETAAQQQIEQLVLSETRQHEYRLRDNAYWDTFLGITPSTGTGDSRDRLRTGPRPSTTPAPLRVAEEQLSEARTMRQEIITLRKEIEELRAEGKTGNDIAVGASRDEVTAIGQVVLELRQLIQETRNTNQANTARAASRR